MVHCVHPFNSLFSEQPEGVATALTRDCKMQNEVFFAVLSVYKEDCQYCHSERRVQACIWSIGPCS